jgi:hypothetical protein
MTGPPRRRRSAGAAATWAITGSKLPSRSRGTSISTGPVAALSTVFGRDPLRTLADSRPPGSPVLLMTQVLGHLLVQRGLEDVLGELLKQPIRPGQRQPPIASQLEELPAASASAELCPAGQQKRCPSRLPGGRHPAEPFFMRATRAQSHLSWRIESPIMWHRRTRSSSRSPSSRLRVARG